MTKPNRAARRASLQPMRADLDAIRAAGPYAKPASLEPTPTGTILWIDEHGVEQTMKVWAPGVLPDSGYRPGPMVDIVQHADGTHTLEPTHA